MTSAATDADNPQTDDRFQTARTLFFVIGAQKSGTTWMSKFMHDHPQIAVPAWKETNYWNIAEGWADVDYRLVAHQSKRDSESPIYTRFREIFRRESRAKDKAVTRALAAARNPAAPHGEYADLLFSDQAKTAQAHGELCPQYALLKPETYREMSQLGPNVRFIFIMRDPVERFISGVRHTLRKSLGRENVTQDAISKGVVETLNAPKSLALRRSDYRLTITDLEQHVPQSHIAYFFYETFFDQNEVQRLCTFLGVDHVTADVGRQVHKGAGSEAKVTQADKARIAGHLSEVYPFMRERFGDRIPEKWHASEALIAEGARAAG
ncbi:sulfotransferase [Yoonia sediminilitoris]|uniref:Sulfotransferase family protein n=1 Tax=Yoonia sediminilitoris TaxID=1286148 RepID=A0A2T6KR91_9RHOB|nr:sulfotransferase [Yoonia sediminilitoris]PUB19069.1 sulfotransferase family protein [Yoonia sediminilitoris]RCW99237.1 sulfotransferase family protein [Yoonia sediminilitoris]